MLNPFQALCCIRVKAFFNGSKLSSQLYEESLASRHIHQLDESFFIAGVFAGYFFIITQALPQKGKWRAHKVIKKGFEDFFLVHQNFFCFKYINGDFPFSSCKIYILLQASCDSWQFYFFFQ